MTTTTDETHYSPTFEGGMGDFTAPQFDEDIDAIRQAEKKLNREGNSLTIAGLLAFGTGIGLFILQLLGMATELNAGLSLLIAGGVGALGFGLIKTLSKLRKKSLDFPLLRKIKKAVRQQRTHSQARNAPPPVQNQGTSKGATMFEESYVRNRLAKSSANKVFLGVCGGVAEYAGISPSLMRFVFLIGLMLSAGVIVPVYIILGLFLPVKK